MPCQEKPTTMAAEELDTWKRPWWLAFLDKAFETNLILTSLTASYLAYTRSAGVAYFAAGAVMCSLTVKLVKRILRQPRPVQMGLSHQKLSYGMPSTHSAAITYYATYVPLACIYLPIHASLPQSSLIRVMPPLVIVPCASLIAVSRIWLGHHTWPQVAVGCSYGIAFACVWFIPWTYGLSEHGEYLEHLLDSLFGWR